VGDTLEGETHLTGAGISRFLAGVEKVALVGPADLPLVALAGEELCLKGDDFL